LTLGARGVSLVGLPYLATFFTAKVVPCSSPSG
jgi:hypothetical protein